MPGWVGASRWLRPVLSTPVGERPVTALTPTILPTMGAEVESLGRSTSSRIEGLQAKPG